MNKNKIALSSLAMDLKRVALGYHNGSEKTAQRFSEEAINRIGDIDLAKVAPYIRKALTRSKTILMKKEKSIAEDALMYSTIFQNAALKT